MVDSSTPSKVCTKCHEEKPLDQFGKDPRYTGGHKNWCRVCLRLYNKERIASDSALVEKERQRHAAARAADPEKHRAKVRASRLRHLEERRARDRAARKKKYAENPQAIRAVNSRYERAHPEVITRYRKRVYAARRLLVLEETARRRAKRYGVAVIEIVDYAAVVERSGGICHICKLPIGNARVQFDHIVPLSLGGPHTAANVALAHAQCNRDKGVKILLCE